MKARGSLLPICSIFALYFICFFFRIVEYFALRTDQSFFGEAFLHKLAGILVLALALRYFSLRWPEIGFFSQSALRYTGSGLLLGAAAYTIAYGAEYAVALFSGGAPSLRLYVTSYSVTGNLGGQTGIFFFAICIVGNIINVVMEEGLFRGLFVRLAQRKYSFGAAVALSSALFGLWHIIGPARAFLDGDMSAMGAMMSALVLVLTSAVGGVKFCLLTKITGSLWMPMADHFVNNTIVNVLHLVTAAGADGLQTVRISIAQTISFLIVLILYWRTGAGKKETFRA